MSFDVCFQCKLHTHDVMAILSTSCHWPFFPTSWDLPCWSGQIFGANPSFDDFATFALSFLTLMLISYKFFFPPCFFHHNSMDIVHLTTILVKIHFQAFWNEFTNGNETNFILETWRTWVMVLSNILLQTCIVAFDVPFANGLQNGVIFHIHLSWNNGFINGEPFLFKCHVLCCTKIMLKIMM